MSGNFGITALQYYVTRRAGRFQESESESYRFRPESESSILESYRFQGIGFGIGIVKISGIGIGIGIGIVNFGTSNRFRFRFLSKSTLLNFHMILGLSGSAFHSQFKCARIFVLALLGTSLELFKDCRLTTVIILEMRFLKK